MSRGNPVPQFEARDAGEFAGVGGNECVVAEALNWIRVKVIPADTEACSKLDTASEPGIWILYEACFCEIRTPECPTFSEMV